MQREHRCSYCDHAHMISAAEIKTAWAFLKCESCGKLSILRGRTPEKISRPVINAAPVVAPKAPTFLVPPPPPATHVTRKPAAAKTASVIKAADANPRKPAEPTAGKPAEFIAAKPAAITIEEAPRVAKSAAKAPNKAEARPFPESLPEVAVAAPRAFPIPRLAGLANLRKIRERLSTRRGPLSVGVLIIAIGLLMMSAQKLKSQAERLAESSIAAAMPTINAPINPDNAPAANAPAKDARESANSPDSKNAQLAPPGNTTQNSAADSVPTSSQDAVHTSAAAPIAPATPPSDPSLFRVAVEKNAVVLRAGPGTNYRKLGLIGTDATLAVLDWREDWFRVGLVNSEPGKAMETAWIRNDFVKRITPTH